MNAFYKQFFLIGKGMAVSVFDQMIEFLQTLFTQTIVVRSRNELVGFWKYFHLRTLAIGYIANLALKVATTTGA